MNRRTVLRLGGAAAVGASLATVGLADPADAQAELALSVDGTERESNLVMYLTADGERVVVKHIRGLKGELDTIPRVITAPPSLLSPSEGVADRLTEAVRRHPEVGE